MSITYPRLVLRGQSYRQQPLGSVLEATFDVGGGMLGRAEGNQLVLEDPGKYISRNHAAVAWRDGRFYLADVGANPSIINDQPLGTGAQIALADGDCLVIGDYVLLAGIEMQAPAAVESDATMLLPPRAPATVQTAAVALPANTAAAVPAPLPLFEPPARVVPAPLPPFEPLMAPPAPAQSPLASLPSDALSSARILDSRHDGADMHDPLGLHLFGDLTPAHSGGGAGQPAAPRYRGAEADHLSPEWQAFTMPPAGPALTPASAAIPADYDPLADFLPASPSTPSALAPAMPATPAAQPALPPVPTVSPVPPTPIAAVSAPAPPAASPTALPAAAPAMQTMPATPQPSAPASANELSILQALLEGLGLPNLRTDRAPEALAHEIGQMLRAATTGTMEVLMARALTKRESHIDMTMIVPRANNPLKFFPDVDTALTQMLGNQMPGYLPPVDAISGAFDDLKAHELAVIAGMRAALAAVVQRFDPARIEQRLSEPGRMDKLLPGGRKARLWDRLLQSYGELARDADEDLQRLFGEKFSLAYEQQVAKLREQRASDTTSTLI